MHLHVEGKWHSEYFRGSSHAPHCTNRLYFFKIARMSGLGYKPCRLKVRKAGLNGTTLNISKDLLKAEN
jgi:hypothetical protein